MLVANRLLKEFQLFAALAFIVLFARDLAVATEDSFLQSFKPMIQKHCAKCHGTDGELAGDVNLLELESVDDLVGEAELVRQLIDVLDLEEMPPEDEPQLDPKMREKMVADLREIFHTAVAKTNSFAPTPLRRMNRFQYNNAVQDLFQLNCVVFTLPERMMREHDNYFQPATGKMPESVKVGSRPLGKSQLIERRLAGVAAFPQDLRAEHGFDNRADHLSLSPLLLESFLNLSRSIVESPDFGPQTCGIWNTFFEEPNPDANVETEVRERLRGFLTTAFRRPVEDELLDRYAKHVLSRIESGASFTDSMKAIASATIASPKFLYLYDQVEENEATEPSNVYDLASRLSFFLWGSIPDQTLLEVAGKGELSNPEVLSAQVDRMLNDRKLKRFCDSFPAQWLQLDRIVSAVPDKQKFPDFYFAKYRSSMHMMLEPLMIFETVLIENRSILELIDSDFSYRSARLEVLYYDGVSNPVEQDETDEKKRKSKPNIGAVTVIPFNRIQLTDRRQGGVITNAAIMSMTSGTERTKPITRGAWLATVVFNDPPEPPPADVPPLDEEPPKDEVQLTLRERLSAHRERADCAGCHEQIDPLGFALENYGPTGKWREEYENGRKVDMSGKLFRQHEFNNVVEFKDAILTEKDRFTRGLASHLLSFAIAREIDVADSIALDKIVGETAADDYRIRTLIKQVVLSEPFRNTREPTARAE